MHSVQHKLLHRGAGLITNQIPSSAIDEISRAGKSGNSCTERARTRAAASAEDSSVLHLSNPEPHLADLKGRRRGSAGQAPYQSCTMAQQLLLSQQLAACRTGVQHKVRGAATAAHRGFKQRRTVPQWAAMLSGADLQAARRVAAKAAAAERDLWYPGTTPPEHLDGSLPGDYGCRSSTHHTLTWCLLPSNRVLLSCRFDPLRLSADEQARKWYVPRRPH